MAIIKCKMCGGDLNIIGDSKVVECEYCGSKQTLPSVDSERKMTLFARANRLLRDCEFDKASGIYESIVTEFPEEAEAYWCLVLCKYGIEYVDDPATGKKVPTCHRSSFDSVMENDNFEMVMNFADLVARRVYREEAKRIEEIRRGIIEISGREEPYDIFISYKETDDKGERTLDSVIAQDIYTELTGKGYRVFFSRITLEDKLGTEYEPYIFAALNSAKIMLSVGTDYDNFNAVWVKNEWSRFLSLIAKGEKKVLIPVFKNIDAYDMPKEFAKLSAQDMGKVGAMQDLLRGVDKIMGRENKPAAVPVVQAVMQQVVESSNVDAIIKRGYIELEDGEWEEANKFFEQVLCRDAENAEAYFGLFMVDINVRNKEECSKLFVDRDYTSNRFWKRANRYAVGKLKSELDMMIDCRASAMSEKDRLAQEEKKKIADEERKRKEAEQQELKRLEEIKRKIEEKKNALREQLRTGEFIPDDRREKHEKYLRGEMEKLQEEANIAGYEYDISPEMETKKKLKRELSEKRVQILDIGIFRGKEKRELQSDIDRIERELATLEKSMEPKKRNIEEKIQMARKARDEYQTFIEAPIPPSRVTARRRLLQLSGYWRTENGTVLFGRYNQNQRIEPIEWIVLEEKENKMLLLSKYAIDCHQFHSTSEEINWEKCDLRMWLNTDFIKTAFNEDEQDVICLKRLTTRKNPYYIELYGAVQSGNVVCENTDRVFLLSEDEVKQYNCLTSCKPTTYALLRGTATEKRSGNCPWLLRTPGRYLSYVAVVNIAGEISYAGVPVNNPKSAVRPAMWIDFNM